MPLEGGQARPRLGVPKRYRGVDRCTAQGPIGQHRESINQTCMTLKSPHGDTRHLHLRRCGEVNLCQIRTMKFHLLESWVVFSFKGFENARFELDGFELRTAVDVELFEV